MHKLNNLEIKEKKFKDIPKPTNFGKNLKFIRRLKGLSQSFLAEQLGISRNKIASYESGIVEPNALTFLKISNYFAIEPREFLENILSENPIELALPVSSSADINTNYLKDHVEDFIIQTNEMSKVLNGYKSFLELQKEGSGYKVNGALYSSLEDLLSLLQMLITSNWKVIQTIIPSQNEEE